MKAKEEYVDAPRETRSKDITVYAIIFLVLLVGAGIFLAVRLLHKPADAALASSKSGIVYDSSAVEGGWDNLSPEEIEARLNEKVAEGMINISANTAPIFEDGSSEGNLMLVNESINNYPQKVQIVRNDTGNRFMNPARLPLAVRSSAQARCRAPAGTYECTAYFHNLDPETGEIIGTAGAIINITIKIKFQNQRSFTMKNTKKIISLVLACLHARFSRHFCFCCKHR